MNKEEFREHCEKQIERCIKLNDLRHLKEHELTLGLLNENEQLIQENQELKKQLNSDDWINSIKEIERHYIYLIETENEKLRKQLEAKESQQREFIELLKNEIEALEFCDNEFILSNHKKEVKAYKEILLKYKEIIGKDINVSTREIKNDN